MKLRLIGEQDNHKNVNISNNATGIAAMTSSLTANLVTSSQTTGSMTPSVTAGLLTTSPTSDLTTSSETVCSMTSPQTAVVTTSLQTTNLTLSPTQTAGLMTPSQTAGRMTSPPTRGWMSSSPVWTSAATAAAVVDVEVGDALRQFAAESDVIAVQQRRQAVGLRGILTSLYDIRRRATTNSDSRRAAIGTRISVDDRDEAGSRCSSGNDTSHRGLEFVETIGSGETAAAMTSHQRAIVGDPDLPMNVVPAFPHSSSTRYLTAQFSFPSGSSSFCFPPTVPYTLSSYFPPVVVLQQFPVPPIRPPVAGYAVPLFQRPTSTNHLVSAYSHGIVPPPPPVCLHQSNTPESSATMTAAAAPPGSLTDSPSAEPLTAVAIIVAASAAIQTSTSQPLMTSPVIANGVVSSSTSADLHRINSALALARTAKAELHRRQGRIGTALDNLDRLYRRLQTTAVATAAASSPASTPSSNTASSSGTSTSSTGTSFSSTGTPTSSSGILASLTCISALSSSTSTTSSCTYASSSRTDNVTDTDRSVSASTTVAVHVDDVTDVGTDKRVSGDSIYANAEPPNE